MIPGHGPFRTGGGPQRVIRNDWGRALLKGSLKHGQRVH